MSLLAQQLSKLKAQNALKIAPGAAVPTFILDKETARNTTIQILYTMAIMGFGEIKKQLTVNGKKLGEQLLSEDYKQINRNKLTQKQNSGLSAKTTKFLLYISPYFLNRNCQTILEYLLRNFRVHIFQPQQLTLIYLQYWQHPTFTDLILNIESKSPSLSFLKALQQKKQLNFAYILKSLTYSRALLENLIMLNRQLIKQQSLVDEEIEIDLMNRKTMISKVLPHQESYLVRNDPKQFLLKVLREIVVRGFGGFVKDICQFCLFACREQNQEARDMCILLSITLLEHSEISFQWVIRIIGNLLVFDLNTNMFHFIMLLSQRWPKCLTSQILSKSIDKQGFLHNLSQFQGSKYMLFYLSYKYYLQSQPPQQSLFAQLLDLTILPIKQQQFIQTYQQNYFSSLFQLTLQKQKSLSSSKSTNTNKNTNTNTKWQFIKNFIHKYMLYEYAVFLKNSQLCSEDVLFGGEIVRDGRVCFQGIQRKRMVRKVVHVEYKKMEEQQQQISQQTKNKKTILQILNNHCKTNYKKLDPNKQQQNKSISQLLQFYYQQNNQQNNQASAVLSPEQKNRLFQYQACFRMYNQEYFKIDLGRQDYVTPIKFVMKSVEPDLCFVVFETLLGEIDQQERKDRFGDLMFRELCRQAIDKLAQLASIKYNKVVAPLGGLYHRLHKISTPQTIMPINSLLLKISRGIFKQVGHNKGKFYKLIAIHSKILAKLNQSHLQKAHEIKQVYSQLIGIFGWENLYCFLIGCIDDIGGRERSNKDLFRLINHIILPSLQQIQTHNKQLYQLLIATQKLAILSYQLLHQQKNSHQTNKIQQTDFGIAVAKKLILNFFGLQKSKGFRKIARKVLVFLSVLFKAQKFQGLFKSQLEETDVKFQRKIQKKCTSVYNILTEIQGLTQGNVRDVTSQIKNKIIQLFPLELRIQVLGPLLPSEQIYKNLAEELTIHSHQKFQHLKTLINILPQKLSKNYIKFAVECIKRKYLPSTKICRQILDDNYAETGSLSQIQFICAMTQHGTEQSLEFLDRIFQIVMRDCSQVNQYSLAVYHQIIGNLREYSDPYMDSMFSIGIQVTSQHTKSFLDRIVDLLTQPSLLTLAKKHFKSVTNIHNFTYFLKKMAQKVNYQPLLKIYPLFCSRSIKMLITEQQDITGICQKLAEVYVEIAMKMNQNQLRKSIIDLVRFGSENMKEDANAGLIFNSRKILVVGIYAKLEEKLGELFNHFYGYIFDEIVQDLSRLTELQTTKNRQKDKRSRQISTYALQCAISYTEQIMKCLLKLFQNDPQNEFMDSIKFDALAPHLASVFSITKFGTQYSKIMNEHVHPCLISLYKNTQDDYKLKTLNTEILRMIRMKQPKINIAIFEFIDKVIPEIDYRFLLFVDELTPILIEFSDTRNLVLKKCVESIVYKIQNLSGKKIQNFVR